MPAVSKSLKPCLEPKSTICGRTLLKIMIFSPNSALGAHINSSKYLMYSSGLIFAAALTLNKNPFFEIGSINIPQLSGAYSHPSIYNGAGTCTCLTVSNIYGFPELCHKDFWYASVRVATTHQLNFRVS
jgi:hypothetical protein